VDKKGGELAKGTPRDLTHTSQERSVCLSGSCGKHQEKKWPGKTETGGEKKGKRLEIPLKDAGQMWVVVRGTGSRLRNVLRAGKGEKEVVFKSEGTKKDREEISCSSTVKQEKKTNR